MKRQIMHIARITLAAVTIGILACSASAQTTLRIALQDDPDALDPAVNWSFVGRHVLQSLCDKIVEIDTEARIVPMLAKDWSWHDGGKTLRLVVREGAKFHDGDPVDAAAIKYNLDRNLTMKGSRRRAEIDVITAVEVVDAMTVDVKLARPSIPLLAALTDRAGMMVSPRAAEAAGERFAQRPFCAGPYRFVERVAQDRIVLERVPDHWRAAQYHFDRVTFTGIPDSTVRLTNLRAGQLDLIERLSPTDIAVVSGDRSLAISEAVGLGYFGVTFNMANGDKRNRTIAEKRAAREAFDLAIDREAINKVVFDSRYEAGNQPFPPGSPWYDKSRPVRSRDLAAARAKLREAGVEKLTLELLVPTDPQRRQVAEMMQSMLAEAGIELKIIATELMSLLARARDGGFESHLVGWSGRSDPDLNITPLLGCSAAGNDGRYCNQQLETMLGEARSIADPAQRKTRYDTINRLLLDELPVVYLYHAKWIFAHKARLAGLKMVPDGIIRLDEARLRD
jgi:peptide/nickel transport system substrate-binding protein